MIIERRYDRMRTTRWIGPLPSGGIFTGEGTTTVSQEIDYRMDQLLTEAEHERLVGRRHGLRHLVGHALLAIGRAVHGPEPDPATRPALLGR
jgi:hypothetical protein